MSLNINSTLRKYTFCHYLFTFCRDQGCQKIIKKNLPSADKKMANKYLTVLHETDKGIYEFIKISLNLFLCFKIFEIKYIVIYSIWLQIHQMNSTKMFITCGKFKSIKF